MIERLAYRLGIVPRAVRNSMWILVLVGAVAALCVWVDERSYSAVLLVYLMAFPFRLRPSSRAWKSQTETEWMLACGAWTRAMLARSAVFEMLTLALSGACALVVIASAQTLLSPGELAWSFFFYASVVLCVQGMTAVLANWNSSSRVPGRLRLPQIRNQEIASPLRVTFIAAFVVILPILTTVKARPAWVLPAGLVMLFATHWLVSGTESVGKDGGEEKTDARRFLVSARRFSVWSGLMREGSRPSARFAVIAAPALLLVMPVGHMFGLRPDSYTLHLLNMGLLSWAAGSPFRWESKSGSAEFICSRGALLRDARRLELAAGLLIGVEMLAVGWLLQGTTPISPNGYLSYAVAFGIVLLVSNQARLPLGFGAAMRVCRLLPWGMLAGLLFAILFTLIGLMSDRDPSWLFATGLGALVILGAAAPIVFWVWAFLRAGDDERLRQDELEPKLYVVQGR